MTAAIFQRSIDVNQVYNLPENNLTNAKVTKYVLGVLATISFAIGYLALTIGSAPSLLLAIPTLTIGGILTWIIVRIKDYQDPKKLEQYRKEAALVPLSKTIATHGWENMFKYELPSNAAFEQLYADCIRNMKVKDMIPFYENALQIAKECAKQKMEVPFDLPVQPLIDRFTEEVKGSKLTACQIFGIYDFEKLMKHGIITQEFYEAKKHYLDTVTQTNQTLQNLMKAYEEQRNKATSKFNEEVKKIVIKGASPDQQSHLAQLRECYNLEMNALADAKNKHMEEIKQRFNQYCAETNNFFAK